MLEVVAHRRGGLRVHDGGSAEVFELNAYE